MTWSTRLAPVLAALVVSSCCMSHGADVADAWSDGNDAGPDAPPAGVCPATQPLSGDPCSGAPCGWDTCMAPLHCEYEYSTCCGRASPTYVCDCLGSQFSCYYVGPCESPPAVGSGACGCTAACPGGTLCEVGLSRCVDDVCARVDCAAPCDSLRGCISPECTTDSDCRLIYSSCSCQAVPVGSAETALDDCQYDGGALCFTNSCTSQGVRAVCSGGLCTERAECADCRTTGCDPGYYCGECLTPSGSAWFCLGNGSAC